MQVYKVVSRTPEGDWVSPVMQAERAQVRYGPERPAYPGVLNGPLTAFQTEDLARAWAVSLSRVRFRFRDMELWAADAEEYGGCPSMVWVVLDPWGHRIQRASIKDLVAGTVLCRSLTLRQQLSM